MINGINNGRAASGQMGQIMEEQAGLANFSLSRLQIPAQVGMEEEFFSKLKNIVAQSGYSVSK